MDLYESPCFGNIECLSMQNIYKPYTYNVRKRRLSFCVEPEKESKMGVTGRDRDCSHLSNYIPDLMELLLRHG